METGVAQQPVDLEVYREQLERRLGKAHEVARMMVHKAKAQPKHVVFPEGDNEKILRACHTSDRRTYRRADPAGQRSMIHAKTLPSLALDLNGVRIVDPAYSRCGKATSQELFRLRQRRGVTLAEARLQIDNRNIFGSMMVHMGDADALSPVSPSTFPTPFALRCRSSACARACTRSPAVTP